MMGPQNSVKWDETLLELKCQPVITFLYTLSHVEGSGFMGIKEIRKSTSGVILTLVDPDDSREIAFTIAPSIEDRDLSVNSIPVGQQANSAILSINLSGMKYKVSIRSEGSIISRFTDIWSKEVYARDILFPFPSHSTMSPFLRFLCMSHNLSGASPVSKTKLIDNSVAEMSIMTLDESRDQVRRACQSTLSMMLSSGTIKENRYGLHIPRNLQEYSRRYRRRFIPYNDRLMKNTLFDFEK
ncbi:MAG: hypothetical protein AAE983_02290 [Thermoplasmataceae archaeon]|jgi:hypothetical protein